MSDVKTTVRFKIGESDLILETGHLAKQANGAVYAEYEGTAVLATVCCSDTAVEGLDYVPVTVDYNEKYYAAGKIPGGFVKRETRPKDKEILVSRLIDRPMRPLFEKSFGREIQIVPTCISADQKNPPDILAVIASSAAVVISDIPFNGPIAAVRVAFIGNEYIINPSFKQIESANMEIVVAGTKDGITMVEGGAKEVSEEVMLEALDRAHAVIKELCRIQEDLRAKCGKEKLPLTVFDVVLENRDEIEAAARPEIEKSFYMPSKVERAKALKAVRDKFAEKYAEQLEDENQAKLFNALFDEIQYTILRKNILEKGKRVDGRGLEDIRPITCEVNVLPRPHGSAIFTRGETQSLSVVTLGTLADEQVYDDIEGETKENFMLHYNFPPYSVGEVGRLATGRREIGHGNLARRSLEPMLPARKDFPYTTRVVSEILESNGSSSMATVCGGTLAMMAAGVPMKKPVAGIAMGLITEGEKYAILSDILGEEDHLGDMDFKVAGTAEGITGFQMDIKIAGVSAEIMKKALEQAKRGRLHILSIMKACIAEPATDISKYAPRIESLKIPVDKIGAVIGSGGKTIQGISEKYNVNINIEDDGAVVIYGSDRDLTDKAKKLIQAMTEEPKVGTIYEGTVKRIMDFGAFVEILPGKEGLCHISKLARKRVEKVEDVLHEGQEIPVKLLDIDRQGRLNLSYIDALEERGESEH